MQEAHIIHAHIALHKIQVRFYSPDIGSEMIRSGNRGAAGRQRNGKADWSNAGHDVQDPNSGNGDRQNSERRTPPPSVPPIRLATLLLPVANHQYDARWTSSPSGRYCFGRHLPRYAPRAEGSGQTHAAGAWVPFPAGATARRLPALQDIHRSGDALLLPASPDRIGGPPPKLPIDISNARRISSPGGRCFLRRTQRKCITRFNLCGKSPNFSQNSARISA